jgi:hypothetical protein
MLPLTWCACYFPKIIILHFKVISEKIRKNPVNTEKTFSMYYNARQIIYPGTNHDPWWDMPQLIAQVDT